jgi:hypothetical protein
LAAPSTLGGVSARRVATRFWRVRSAIQVGSLAEELPSVAGDGPGG